MLSQLSYTPSHMVGLGRLELPTSRLSGVRSNHLSYKPAVNALSHFFKIDAWTARSFFYIKSISLSTLFSLKGGDPAAPSDTATLLRLHPSY